MIRFLEITALILLGVAFAAVLLIGAVLALVAALVVFG